MLNEKPPRHIQSQNTQNTFRCNHRGQNVLQKEMQSLTNVKKDGSNNIFFLEFMVRDVIGWGIIERQTRWTRRLLSQPSRASSLPHRPPNVAATYMISKRRRRNAETRHLVLRFEFIKHHMVHKKKFNNITFLRGCLACAPDFSSRAPRLHLRLSTFCN